MSLMPRVMPRQTAGVSIVENMSRRNRYPQHPFHVRQKAFSIQPIMIAPVLPGETLKQALFQSRVVTDPITNPLIGWWVEYYFFYVKHRDLVGDGVGADLSTDLQEMMLDVNKDMSAYNEAADVNYKHLAGTMNFTKKCLIRVVEEYFRDEGEAWDVLTDASGMPQASVGYTDALQSVMRASDYATPDVEIPVGVDDLITASEIEAAQREYEFMRLQGVTNMTYEDYLASYGIKTRDAEQHVPELIRYFRDWTYPANAVEPTDGSVSSACSWAVQERISKPRLFREPGFIFGCCVVRPKVYSDSVRGNFVDYMTDAFSWLPAAMQGERSHSLKAFAAGTGPLPLSTVDYIFDIRDLLLYGQQFQNFDLGTATAFNGVTTPNAAMGTLRYAPVADVAAMFVDSVGGNDLIRQDGVVNLTIAGMQTDLTPRTRP